MSPNLFTTKNGLYNFLVISFLFRKVVVVVVIIKIIKIIIISFLAAYSDIVTTNVRKE